MKRKLLICSFIVVILVVAATVFLREPPAAAQAPSSTAHREAIVEKNFTDNIKAVDSLLNELPAKREKVRTIVKRKVKEVRVKPALERVIFHCNEDTVVKDIERVNGDLIIEMNEICHQDTGHVACKPRPAVQKRNIFQRIFNRKR